MYNLKYLLMSLYICKLLKVKRTERGTLITLIMYFIPHGKNSYHVVTEVSPGLHFLRVLLPILNSAI